MYLTHEITVKTSKGMQRLQTLHINIHEGYSNYTITGSPVTWKSLSATNTGGLTHKDDSLLLA